MPVPSWIPVYGGPLAAEVTSFLEVGIVEEFV
jgi:hypothetical protein